MTINLFYDPAFREETWRFDKVFDILRQNLKLLSIVSKDGLMFSVPVF